MYILINRHKYMRLIRSGFALLVLSLSFLGCEQSRYTKEISSYTFDTAKGEYEYITQNDFSSNRDYNADMFKHVESYVKSKEDVQISIVHFIQFSDNGKFEGFKKEIITLGYDYDEREYMELSIEATISGDPRSIEESSLSILNMVKKYEGEYGHWQLITE